MRVIGLVAIFSLTLALLASEAQQPGKVFRIGVLTTVPLPMLEASSLPALSKAQGRSSTDNPGRCGLSPYGLLQWALCRVGYIEGQNIAIEARWGAPDRPSVVATELVSLKVDVIHAIGPVAIRAAKQATASVPIVMMTSGDPVALGFVESMARPGGNVTRVSFLGEQLAGKLLELLKEAVPKVAHVAVLWNPANGTHAAYLREAQAAAQRLGVTLHTLEGRPSDDFDRVFGRITRERGDAVIMLLDPLFSANLSVIAKLATKSRVPALYAVRELAAGHQPQDREGTGPDYSAIAPGAGGPGDRMMDRPAFITTVGGSMLAGAAGRHP